MNKHILFSLLFLAGTFISTAQPVSYSPLYDNSTFPRSIDLSKPVGAIDGAAGTTPSGGTTYSIPIKCPPGTHGMVPGISLVYNSQSGNGIMGQGWNLSGLSVITRAGADHYHDGKATPVNYTNEDVFVMDGTRLYLKAVRMVQPALLIIPKKKHIRPSPRSVPGEAMFTLMSS